MKNSALLKVCVFVLSILTVQTYEAGRKHGGGTGGAAPSGNHDKDTELRKEHKAAQDAADQAQKDADAAQARADKLQAAANKKARDMEGDGGAGMGGNEQTPADTDRGSVAW